MDYGLKNSGRILLFAVLLVRGPVPLFAQTPPANTIEQNAPLAEAVAKLDQMQTKLQELEGGLEAQNILAKQLDTKVERNYRDLEMRLKAVEEKIKLFQDALEKALAKISPQASQEFKKFQGALNWIQAGDYTKALSTFQQILTQYPKSAQKGEALFWIAECRYALKDYSQAIKDYQKFVQAYPKSEKNPQATLKQGDGFLNLNMTNEAKVFFKKLIQDYPNSEEATQAKGRLAALDKEGQTPSSGQAPGGQAAPSGQVPSGQIPATNLPPPPKTETPKPQEY